MSEANDNPGLLEAAAAEGDAEGQTTEGQEQSISHTNPDPNADDGPLERPDFWPEKFWNKESAEPDLEGISKSYVELEKKFRAGGHKPPEDGKYELESLNLSDKDPVVSAYVGWAQKYGISQTAFEELARSVNEIGGRTAETAQFNMQAELEALGPNAKAIVADMATWGRGMVQKGTWSQEEFQEFTKWGDTARGIKALYKLRQTYEGRVPLETIKSNSESSMSKEELEAMVGTPEYYSNPAYRAKVERLFEKMYPDK